MKESLVRVCLYLHQFTRLSRRSGGDDQIALLRHSVALCHLPYRSDRIDDSRTSRIGHESSERLKTAATVRIVREREDERLLGRASGDCSLQDVDGGVVEGRDLRERRRAERGQDEVDRVCGGAEWLERLQPRAARVCVRRIGPPLLLLPGGYGVPAFV